MRFVLAALAAIPLLGCTPEYNWREIRSADDGWSVMLPGKPASMSRRIRLDTVEVTMTMQGAKIGDTTFTVATAVLPEDTAAARELAVAAMRAGMLRNIEGTQTAARDVAVPVIDAAGKAIGERPAVRIEADGAIKGRPVTMSAGFAADGPRAWQWVVIGHAVDREQASTFLDSFRVLRSSR